MLAKENRVLSGDDFRAAVRRGRRVTTRHSVVYSLALAVERPPRFGFIIAKTVGGSVVRNRMRRRLRSISRDILNSPPVPADGTDVVIRMLPGSHEVDWASLHSEITGAVHRSARVVEAHRTVDKS